MKKLEPKKKEVIEEPIVEPTITEPETPVKITKEKPDYTWVWVLVGLLATIATVYFMNVENKKGDGNIKP